MTGCGVGGASELDECHRNPPRAAAAGAAARASGFGLRPRVTAPDGGDGASGDGVAGLTPPTAAASGRERGRLGGAARASALGVGIIKTRMPLPSPASQPRNREALGDLRSRQPQLPFGRQRIPTLQVTVPHTHAPLPTWQVPGLPASQSGFV